MTRPPVEEWVGALDDADDLDPPSFTSGDVRWLLEWIVHLERRGLTAVRNN